MTMLSAMIMIMCAIFTVMGIILTVAAIKL